jgi:Zn-dependent peptidase ImmA (M78 family)
MAKYGVNPSKYSHLNVEKLRKIYFKIKRLTNALLSPYNDDSFVNDPSVDIRTVAVKNGIIEIKDVPPEIVFRDHARMKDSKIELNKKDSEEEKRFSIAHDLKHDMQDKLQKKEILITSSGFKKPDILNKPRLKRKAVELERYARLNDKTKIPKHKYSSLFKDLSKFIAVNVSGNFVKKVSEKKSLKVLNELYFCGSNNIFKPRLIDRTFILDAINKLYDEEISDYFAANLLVPTERFILWEDKSDRKIAKAFKVPVKCIKKRREEIQFEIDFTTLENLLPDDNIG